MLMLAAKLAFGLVKCAAKLLAAAAKGAAWLALAAIKGIRLARLETRARKLGIRVGA
ncbi:hypothetical protein [uncultured Alistipes sp.]|nr:hypothetical protein [uncultured Alistipes sp.]